MIRVAILTISDSVVGGTREDKSGPALAAQELHGVFHIGSGSYIRMGLPNGGFFANPYSKDSNKTYTLISSGVG